MSRSRVLLIAILAAVVLSVAVTGYRTLVLQDYPIIDEPLEEELMEEEGMDTGVEGGEEAEVPIDASAEESLEPIEAL